MNDTFRQVSFVTIDEQNEHQRIDNFLHYRLKGVPKGKVYKILRKGEVRVNKKRIKPDYKLCVGDHVRIPPLILDTPQSAPQPPKRLVELVRKNIIYEDDRLLVINKPSGVAVHGGSGVNLGVIELLRYNRQSHEYLELVHRIDRDTSGCLVMAKKRSALRALHEQLREKKIEKVYHAVVRGQWQASSTICDAPLIKNQLRSGERLVRVDYLQGKQSKTKFRLLKTNSSLSVVEARPITGRTHQIRVHCAELGFPIANDDKYGDAIFDKQMKTLGCSRLCLHAYSISFMHPVSSEKVTLYAEYDEQLKRVII